MNPYVQYMYSYPHKTAYGPLEGTELKDYVQHLKGKGHGLYVHLPFCRTRCGYCNLFSVAGQGAEEIKRYLDTVDRQSGQYEELLKPWETEFSELVIGGGTPLFLTPDQLERMFCILKRHFSFADDRGLVIETAPGETDREKLEVLRRAGVTRVSMGIQSFSDDELRTLRRRHSADRAREALELLGTFGFDCLNVDFIYGIPGQTPESLKASLKEALTYGPEEIFLYPLYVKPGTGLWQSGNGRPALYPEDALLQYREAGAYLRSEGYRQDSMRRFVRSARPREYSECGFGTSLALGCGGRSYVGPLHFCTPYAVTGAECRKRLMQYENTADFTKITHGYVLDEEEQRRRYAIRHLLIRPGLSLFAYRDRFGTDAPADLPVLRRFEEQGFAYRENGYLTLTETGLSLSDYLGPQLISETVRGKMEEWERMYGQV